MDFPGDMALDPKGRLWVADTGNSRFAIFDPDGTFVEYWEHRGTGEGEFILEQSNGDGFGAIAFAPDGSFYVLDVGNRRVEHFDNERRFISSWGGFGSGPGQYEAPVGIAVDANGVVYVLDQLRNVVEHYDANGTVLGSFSANPAPSSANSTGGLAVDAQGFVYVTRCCPEPGIEKFDAAGALLAIIGSPATGQGQFNGLYGAVAIDAAGRVFVPAVGDGDKIKIFDDDGTFLASFASPGSADGQVDFPYGMVLDSIDNVYVADAASNRVEKFRLLPPFAP
jgi:tripartite motif-containing protein 71